MKCPRCKKYGLLAVGRGMATCPNCRGFGYSPELHEEHMREPVNSWFEDFGRHMAEALKMNDRPMA